MTNPNNAVGTNAAYSGRTSVNAFNDVLSAFTGRGVLSGWGCSPSSGMTVALGGDGNTRDVAIAEDNSGNFTTVNNISASPIEVTLPAAPTTNSRIDSIVAYVVKPPVGIGTEADNPQACGLIVVSGATAASPSAPTEAAIRSAITADGAAGNNAYYVVLAQVTVTSGATVITADAISPAEKARTPNTIEYDVLSADLPLGANSPTKVASVVIPEDGVYRVEAFTRLYQGGDTYASAEISTTSTVLVDDFGNFVSRGGSFRCSVAPQTTVALKAGDVVSFIVTISNSSATVRQGGNLFAMRVA